MVIPSPAPLLRARDVGITHDGATRAAPAAASLEIALGEVVLLLGPSGSGKSTLALALNGLIPQAVPATVVGSVHIDGKDAGTTPVAHLSASVAMVFQDPDAQLVTGTVFDEVAFGPENLCLPVDEVLARAEDALRRVGLWQRRHENPDRLSGGGRQRLAIACALALGSPLIVLDEPTANLDPAGIEEVYATLAEVVATGDRSVLLIEHNLDAAIGFTDRVMVLDHDGRTVADGPVGEVLRERAAELHAMGVWLPISTLAALRLQRAGWRFDRLPLDPAELRAAVEAADAPGEGVAGATPPGGETAVGTAPGGNSPGTMHSGGDMHSGGSNRRDASSPVQISSRSEGLSTGVAGSRATTTTATTTTTHPAVEVTGLSVRRGRTEVLRDIDLTVAPGEFVAIVGANGAGKTSLLHAIAGIVPVAHGQVRVDGIDVARADARDISRRIGFVFQNPEHQFIAHTVFDELAHGLRRQKLPEDAVRARVSEILHRFGLEQKADAHPFLLSGGQKRRLSVGTALVAGAPVLALDEPTFGQDRARAEELLALLADLNAEGTTVLVVTHDMQLVTDHAARTVVIDDGRIAADAPTPDVFADEPLLRRAGLRLPPLRTALQGITRHPELARAARLADLPGAPR